MSENSSIPNERPSGGTAGSGPGLNSDAERRLPRTPCSSSLVSILREVGDKLKAGLEMQDIECDVTELPTGFKIWIGGIDASLCVGARGDTEKPEICVGALERGINRPATQAHFAKRHFDLKGPPIPGNSVTRAELEEGAVV